MRRGWPAAGCGIARGLRSTWTNQGSETIPIATLRSRATTSSSARSGSSTASGSRAPPRNVVSNALRSGARPGKICDVQSEPRMRSPSPRGARKPAPEARVPIASARKPVWTRTSGTEGTDDSACAMPGSIVRTSSAASQAGQAITAASTSTGGPESSRMRKPRCPMSATASTRQPSCRSGSTARASASTSRCVPPVSATRRRRVHGPVGARRASAFFSSSPSASPAPSPTSASAWRPVGAASRPPNRGRSRLPCRRSSAGSSGQVAAIDSLSGSPAQHHVASASASSRPLVRPKRRSRNPATVSSRPSAPAATKGSQSARSFDGPPSRSPRTHGTVERGTGRSRPFLNTKPRDAAGRAGEIALCSPSRRSKVSAAGSPGRKPRGPASQTKPRSAWVRTVPPGRRAASRQITSRPPGSRSARSRSS